MKDFQLSLLEQLEMYISSGLALDASLRVIAENTPKRDRVRVENILKEVESGGLLSISLEKHAHLPQALVGIIEHGESVGSLAISLRSAHQLISRQDELKKKCLSALTYPLVIGVLALVMTIGLVRGVIPQISPILTGMRVELPLLTRIFIGLSDTLVAYGYYIFFGLIISSTLLVVAFRRFSRLRSFVQRVLFFVPIVGRLYFLYGLSIFLRSLGTLVGSGISIAKSYPETLRSVAFDPLKNILAGNMDSITNGASVHTAFRDKDIPAFVSSLIMAGESSGTLGQSLSRAAEIIDRDLEHRLKRLTSLIEPIMMVAVGGVVGAVALSIMLPIYDMSKVLQHAH
jgi:type IV pilus assembly protein PilC